MEGRQVVAVDNSRELFFQSYARGLVVFIYGLAWLVGLLAGYLLVDRLFGAPTMLLATVAAATWSAGLAGAMGGTTMMLTHLYQHMSIKQDFQRQSLLLYFIQPMAGLIAGVLSLYLISIPGALIFDFVTELDLFLQNISLMTFFPALSSLIGQMIANLSQVMASPTFMALQILVAWIAGFYQQVGFVRIKSAGQRFVAGPRSETTTLPAAPELDENEPLFFKLWVQHRRQMFRWSYTWGLFILLYGLAWLVGLLIGYLLTGAWLAGLAESGHAALQLILAAGPAAVAGCCGGVFSLLNDLHQHVSIKQDFHRQHLMSYLVQPVTGFIFGLVMYLFIASGYLSLSAIANQEVSLGVAAPPVIMIQLVLGWIAGFRQQAIIDIIQRIVEGVIALFKAILAFFNPANLFDQVRRQEKAEEISKELGLFEALKNSEGASVKQQE